MFDRQKYRWYRWRIDRRHAKALKASKAKHDDRAEQSIVADTMFDVILLDEDVNFKESWRLRNEAILLDVEIPPITQEANDQWTFTNDGRRFLTAKSRANLRKAIDEEEARRFEVRTRWVTKLILPLAGGAVGIIGALIGLVAAFKK